ncbi:Golgi complex component 7-domain-containing protein [Schizophyllum amplum]|uniref:Conserved oligomeric Golgi complex subunit 7 n=1 Tax=Schizophyllum amplum TaxID=97359 RepID=A0A550CXA5_9AGAR|nr:Golgi complex component 7-domain-containing protein [Auriculariopsis ampla]
MSTETIASLEEYDDVVSWINDVLDGGEDSDVPGLTELDQRVTGLVASLDIACEDTSFQLERIIDDVSRGVPRLTYDLHFMRDGAVSLQSALLQVRQRSKSVVPPATSTALDHLKTLDTMKRNMEEAREVLREAESWSTLELEVTSLLAEQNYAKAAERLSEANKSMVVFQNTPEYDPRRTLMVNLQNQLEASLSSALVSAINAQDLPTCRHYFSIFAHIQRESEFRNYYNGSKRSPHTSAWQEAKMSDCGEVTRNDPMATTFATFLQRWYASLLNLLNQERTTIPAIFPDPAQSLSGLFTSVLSSLQPTYSQRLSGLVAQNGDSSLRELITVFKTTEEFAGSVEKVFEKIRYSATPEASPDPANSPPARSGVHRRRSSRMSISWRPGARPSTSGLGVAKSLNAEDLDWDQELFQPFLQFQTEYGSLERRILDEALHSIITSKSAHERDQARLLRERSVDVLGAAEESVHRCTSFTYGYGAVGLVQALDGYFQAFIDMWTASVDNDIAKTRSVQSTVSESDLADLDYSQEDWDYFQTMLHLLSATRALSERLTGFEAKLRSQLAQIATKFRLARDSPEHFPLTSIKGEAQMLEQSALNSAELHALLEGVDPEAPHDHQQPPPTPGFRSTFASAPGSPAPLLLDARSSVGSLARACQISLQGTILSPLQKHLAAYPSSSLWNAPGDPKARQTVAGTDLQVPTFSTSPSDIVQRVAEGMLNLPRLFEVYADDDALSFSLATLPNLDQEMLKSLVETPAAAEPPSSHMRRASIAAPPKPAALDPEAVSSAWLASLGQTLVLHLTADVLPQITKLSPAGAAQLVSDLEYLSNILRALNTASDDLERWKQYVALDNGQGRKLLLEGAPDDIFQSVAEMRGWTAR